MHTIHKILALITFLVADIQSHGFRTDTILISCGYEPFYLQCIFKKHHVPQCIPTFDCTTKKHKHGTIVALQPGTTNCYVRIGLDDDPLHDIICTPSQEFYLPDQRKWAEACTLNVGDHLLARLYEHKPITSITFYPEPCDLYIVEVSEPHTFFVGTHAVLVKNMILPCVTIGYTVPFGCGTGSGVISTLLGGTVSCTLGWIVGGVAIGYVIKRCLTSSEKRHDFVFDVANIGYLFQEKSESSVNESTIETLQMLYKTVEDILKGAHQVKEGNKTGSESAIFEKPGNYEDAEEDFISMEPTDIKPIPIGKWGFLPNGDKVIVRHSSSDTRPTLEIQSKNGEVIKIRYGTK